MTEQQKDLDTPQRFREALSCYTGNGMTPDLVREMLDRIPDTPASAATPEGNRPPCPDCSRPVASDDDWRDVPEGERPDLCWGRGANCEQDHGRPTPGTHQMTHPHYYTWIPSHPCHELVPHFPFLLGNAIKYIYRAGRKDPETKIEDLEKAIHSLQIEVDRLKETEK